MKATIAVLAGDGIGPEVTLAAQKVLLTLAGKTGHEFVFNEALIGGAAIDKTGVPLPDETLTTCKSADAVLLGAVGGPAWDNCEPTVRPEAGLLGIRQALGLYCNLRPTKTVPSLFGFAPLKKERLEGVDFVVVRELTGGIYFGSPRTQEGSGNTRRAVDSLVYTAPEIERIAVKAFEIAKTRRRHVTSIDKANVLASSRLWREVVTEVSSKYPDVTLEHQLVDSAAMRLVTEPKSFDVVVTGNLFGDILSDEASVLAGSLGLLPSASLGDDLLGLYEPVHGSAPDIAGKGIANPMATVLSAAMLLRHSLSLSAEASVVENAVDLALQNGTLPRDLGGTATTSEVTTAISNAVSGKH